VYICVKTYLKRFCLFFSLFFIFSENVVRVSSADPHETTLVHWGGTYGFKGLVAQPKCNRAFYESELGGLIIFFFFSFIFTRERDFGLFVMGTASVHLVIPNRLVLNPNRDYI